MEELSAIKKLTDPIETILVVDSLTGQDAANIAEKFNQKLSLTSCILTRIDGDSRGGAALSITAITGCPIKYVGIGEKMSEFQEFHPERIASRILGKGDIVSLVEQAAANISQKDAEEMAGKLKKGKFDLNDLLSQLRGLKKMGGISSMLNLLPGMNKIKNQLGDKLNEKTLKHQEAIILSMTDKERRDYKLINGSRRKRIAAGSGLTVQEVNQLLNHFQEMSNMMKRFAKMDQKSLLRSGFDKLLS